MTSLAEVINTIQCSDLAENDSIQFVYHNVALQ